jgi:hypothetical protein
LLRRERAYAIISAIAPRGHRHADGERDEPQSRNGMRLRRQAAKLAFIASSADAPRHDQRQREPAASIAINEE